MSKNMLLVFSTRTSSSCQRLSAIFISMTLLARIHSCIHCSFIHCSFSGLHFSARKLGFWLLLAASNLDCLPLAGFEFCSLKVRGRGFFRPCCNSIFLISRELEMPLICVLEDYYPICDTYLFYLLNSSFQCETGLTNFESMILIYSF